MNNQEVAGNFCRALMGGDNETAKALLHPDFRIHEAEALPYGGSITGSTASFPFGAASTDLGQMPATTACFSWTAGQ